MTGTIYLLRHGQADSAAAGRGQWQRGMEEQYDRLTRVGHRQAQLVTAELQRRLKGGAALVSGPLRRQRDTLAPLSQSLGLSPTVMEGWCEFNSDSVVAPYLDEHPEGATAWDIYDRRQMARIGSYFSRGTACWGLCWIERWVVGWRLRRFKISAVRCSVRSRL